MSTIHISRMTSYVHVPPDPFVSGLLLLWMECGRDFNDENHGYISPTIRRMIVLTRSFAIDVQPP